jgi:hypothetical protein
MAHMRSAAMSAAPPLSGDERTQPRHRKTDAFDPEPTWAVKILQRSATLTILPKSIMLRDLLVGAAACNSVTCNWRRPRG